MQHKALFDIEIIKNNIEFPLTFDGYGYIFDQDGTMIAQKCKNLSRESAQDFVNLVNSFDLNNFQQVKTNLFTLNEEEYICHKFKPIISIRGWGHWQYVPNGENIYKNIANFLTYCCNCENFDVNLLQN
jgi:hypothetical protein